MRSVDVVLRHPGYRLDKRPLTTLFAALERWEEQRIPEGELSVALLTDAELAELHARFLEDPSPTDVITFPGDAELASAGEICVSLDRAAEQAGRRGIALSEELRLYLVHGWLHLAGLDDTTAPARRAMRVTEKKALAWLRAQGAGLDGALEARAGQTGR